RTHVHGNGPIRAESLHGAHGVRGFEVRVHAEHREVRTIPVADLLHPVEVVRVAAEIDRTFGRLDDVPEGAAVRRGLPDPARSWMMSGNGDDLPTGKRVLVSRLHDEHLVAEV